MATSNEEHLLKELLRDLRAADERVDAAALEARVLAAWDSATVRPASHRSRAKAGSLGEGGKPDSTYYIAAAAGLIAVVWLMSGRPEPEPLPVVRPPVRPAASIDKPVELPAKLPIAQSPTIQSPPIAQSPITQLPIEFVPLVPLAEHELAGSFQIVRVQMPRASLGALTSPFEHPGEFVEADVLLGEDGMARAIRVSTTESVYPRRSQ